MKHITKVLAIFVTLTEFCPLNSKFVELKYTYPNFGKDSVWRKYGQKTGTNRNCQCPKNLILP